MRHNQSTSFSMRSPCHPERSSSFASRMNFEIEGSAVLLLLSRPRQDNAAQPIHVLLHAITLSSRAEQFIRRANELRNRGICSFIAAIAAEARQCGTTNQPP